LKYPRDLIGGNSVKTFTANGTEDCLKIINYIKEKPAHIEIISSDKAVKQRIIDVLCGASVALDLGLCMIDKNNILIIKK
jgi:hypothetical protein